MEHFYSKVLKKNSTILRKIIKVDTTMITQRPSLISECCPAKSFLIEERFSLVSVIETDIKNFKKKTNILILEN